MKLPPALPPYPCCLLSTVSLSAGLLLAAAGISRGAPSPLTERLGEADRYRLGDLAGQHGWRVEQGKARVAEEGGERFVEILPSVPHGQASLYFDPPAGDAPVFLDFVIRMGAESGALDLVDANGSIASVLRVGQDGSLLARHFGGEGTAEWLDTAVRLPLDGSGAMRDWVRLTLRQDPARKTWDLYVDGAMRGANLGLAADVRESGGYFSIMGGETCPVRLRELSVDTRNMLFVDNDLDGLPDDWQNRLAKGERDEDADADGLANLDEYIHGTNPSSADSDGDGWTDLDELAGGSNPLKADQAEEEQVLAEWRQTAFPEVVHMPQGLYECRRDGVFRRPAGAQLPLPRLEYHGLLEDHYTSRVQGLLTAPATGDYTFWVAGDDFVEFWLSDDASPYRRKLVARCPSSTDPLAFDVFGAQRSVSIPLQQGRTYYFEVLHQESAGEDHFSVAWQIPGSPRSVVSGRYLKPWKRDGRDQDRDGLPDDWQKNAGLLADQKSARPEADPDGDRLSNLEEYRLGSNPLVRDAEARAGLVTREIWFGMPGRYLFDAAAAGNFPHQPWWMEYQDSFEAPRDIGENFLARTRGWLVVPEDGTYTFHLAADDQAELWLGQNEDKFSRRRLASVPVHTPWREWNRFASQTSAPLQLRKGQQLYVETLHKQGLGESHLSLAWTKPGSSTPVLITGADLVSWKKQANDADDNDLPDDWQTKYSLTAGTSPESATPAEIKRVSAWGDADGDGILNGDEFLAGTDPDNSASRPEIGLQWQIWRNQPGSSLGVLKNHPGFPSSPDETRNLLQTDYSDTGENYLSRVRGFLAPPVSGEYTLSISGSDNSQLWLSTDESPFHRRLVAEVALITAWRDKDRNLRQISSPIPLEAGKRYYVEILHKKGTGRDHLAVGWNMPGLGQSIIPRDFLQPWRPDPADADDDGLPDAWEKEQGLDPRNAGADHGSFGDPDGDLASNFMEYRQNTEALKADSGRRPGWLLQETWGGLTGLAVDQLLSNPRFPAQPDHRGLVEGAEMTPDRGEWQGSRLRGYLVPPVTGTYRLMVSGDDQVILNVSGSSSKFGRKRTAAAPFWTGEREFSLYPQQTASFSLEAGRRYYFELLQKQEGGRDHASLAWVLPGTTEAVIPAGSSVEAFVPDPDDLDDDELPDSWENEYGIDARDNGNTTFAHGPWGDPDGDRIPNLTEWVLGTNPAASDTDGDGLDDGLEHYVLGTAAAVRNNLAVSPAATVFPKNGVIAAGSAEALYNGLKTTSLTGSAAFTFSVETDGPAWFRLLASVVPQASVTPVYLAVSLDGAELGLYPLHQQEGSTGSLSGALPRLPRGSHQLRIGWVVPERGKSLFFEKLEVFQTASEDQPSGQPVDGSGNSLLGVGGEGEVLQSLTSPWCLEGTANFKNLVRISSGETVHPLPDLGWYADVPLREDGHAREIRTTFEFGAEARTVRVAWQALNVLEAQDLKIRAGDALRLTAFPAALTSAVKGRVTLRVNGSSGTLTTPDDPVEHVFPAPGDYEVEAEFVPVDGTAGLVAGLSGSTAPLRKKITVKVLAVTSPEILVYTSQARQVTIPGLSSEAEVSADSSVYLSERHLSDPRTFTLSRSRPGQGMLAVRLPGRGSVLAAIPVRSVAVFSDVQTFYRHAGRYPDGTSLLEMDVFMPEMTPGLRVRIDILAAGVTFADGSNTLWLTAEDFADGGLAKVGFVLSPGLQTSFCHQVTLYDGDTVIGAR